MTKPTVVTLADVAPERVEWLWFGYLPRGKLVTLDGDPGVAKSTLTMDLAARVTTGHPMPANHTWRQPADVLLLSAEDGLADTIRPRLDAARADPSRVHALTEVTETREDGTTSTRPPSLPADLLIVEGIVKKHGVVLVVIDVLMAYLAGGVDSHRDQDIRRVLHQVSAMAERCGCTVILIRHMNKSGGSQAMYRGGGSIGIVGAARAALLVAIDPDDETGVQRVLAPIKMNLCVEPPALGYKLVSDPVLDVARIEWCGVTKHKAADLLRSGDPDQSGDRDAVATWLQNYIGDKGEVPAKELLRAGSQDGFSADQLKRAKTRAGVVSRKGGMTGGWVWALSEGSTEGSEGSALPEPAPFAPFVLPSVRSCRVCGTPLDRVLGDALTHPSCETPLQSTRSVTS